MTSDTLDMSAPAGAEEETGTAIVTEEHANGFGEEWKTEDMPTPWLSLVSGSSALAESFMAGTWVYAKELDLGQELTVIFANPQKSYEQALTDAEQNAGVQAETWASENEAKASGLKYKAVGTFTLLIELPKDHEAFASCWVENGDVGYLPAKFSVRGSAYSPSGGAFKTVAGVVLRDTIKGWLNGDISSGRYTMSRTKEVYNSNTYFRARLKAAGKVDPDFRKRLKDEFGI